MIRLNSIITLCFLFILSIFSCQKEVSYEVPDDSTSNVVTSLDSNYLDRILIVDSSNANLVDSSIWVFHYDVQKRVSKVVFKSITNPVDSQLYAQFSYLANDTLPFRAKTFTDSADYYFSYDNTGRLKKDSIINYGSTGSSNPFSTLSVNNYTYATNKIFVNGYFIDPNSAFPNPQYGIDTLFQDSRGNIITTKIYSSNTTSNYTLDKTIVSTYDLKKSPYAKVPGFKVFLFTFGDFPASPTVNNFLSDIIYDNSLPTNTLNYSNSYYPNGFLKKTDVTGDSQDSWTYFYKSL